MNLSSGQREAAYHVLFSMLQDGVLPHGAKAKVAAQFAVHPSAISRLWARCQRTVLESANGIAEVRSRKNKCGRRPKYDPVQLKF
jgi:hypothetical protein